MAQESLDAFIARHSRGYKGIPQGVEERWQQRIYSQGLHKQGAAGASMYLSRYGKSIGVPKLVDLARVAQREGYPEMAEGFWSRAYEIEHGRLPTAGATPTMDAATLKAARSLTERRDAMLPNVPLSPEFQAFPVDMQPGRFAPMQPVDAKHDRAFYIKSDAYWGQPKRDGEKLVVFVTPDQVLYQARSMKLNDAPDPELDRALRAAAKYIGGPYILEGELWWRDAEGKEHMKGATCLARNIQLGKPDAQPEMVFTVFACLFDHAAKGETQSERITKGSALASMLATVSKGRVEAIETARTSEEKQALADKQVAEGREGEVWFKHTLKYYSGKKTDDGYVRTKYAVGPKPYRITDVALPNADGHFIGGFTVCDLEGKDCGSVGTGYTRDEQKEIAARWEDAKADSSNGEPNPLFVLVDAQTFTAYGKLRHARFVRLLSAEEAADLME